MTAAHPCLHASSASAVCSRPRSSSASAVCSRPRSSPPPSHFRSPLSSPTPDIRPNTPLPLTLSPPRILPHSSLLPSHSLTALPASHSLSLLLSPPSHFLTPPPLPLTLPYLTRWRGGMPHIPLHSSFLPSHPPSLLSPPHIPLPLTLHVHVLFLFLLLLVFFC